MTNEAHLTLGLLESDLQEAYIILEQLEKVLLPFETEETGEELVAAIDKELPALAKVLAKGISDEQAEEMSHLALMSFAAKKARQRLQFLLSAVEMARVFDIHESELSSDALIQWANDVIEKEEYTEANREEFMNNLPWLVRAATDYIASSGIYQENPTSGVAIGLRILACVLTKMDAMGFSLEEPEHIAA